MKIPELKAGNTPLRGIIRAYNKKLFGRGANDHGDITIEGQNIPVVYLGFTR